MEMGTHGTPTSALVPRRVIRALCEDFRPRHAPKGARDLLVDFHHPDVLFGLIIRIRYAKIGHKSKYRILVLIQAIQ